MAHGVLRPLIRSKPQSGPKPAAAATPDLSATVLGPGIEPASQCSLDNADPIVAQWKLPHFPLPVPGEGQSLARTCTVRAGNRSLILWGQAPSQPHVLDPAPALKSSNPSASAKQRGGLFLVNPV